MREVSYDISELLKNDKHDMIRRIRLRVKDVNALSC